MREDDFTKFDEAMTILGETFDTKVSPQRRNIYFEALSKYPWESVESCIKRAIQTYRFFPKPVELIELIEGTKDDQADQAEQAWQQFYKALTQAGTYQSLYCEDRILAESIRQIFGDWVQAGMLPRPDSDDGPMYQVRHKEFVACYRRLARLGGSFDPYLMGRIESENTATQLAQFGQGLVCTYLPRTGIPDAVELRALMPDHPIVALRDRADQGALPAASWDDEVHDG